MAMSDADSIVNFNTNISRLGIKNIAENIAISQIFIFHLIRFQ